MSHDQSYMEALADEFDGRPMCEKCNDTRRISRGLYAEDEVCECMEEDDEETTDD